MAMTQRQKEEYNERLKIYLGDYYKDYTNLTTEDRNNFKNLNIEKFKSYIVYHSNYEILRKFATYYLIKEEYDFLNYDVNLYKDNYVENIDKNLLNDVIILHYHKNVFERGNTLYFLLDLLSETMTTRQRSNRASLLLSEKVIPELEQRCDVEIIDLCKSPYSKYKHKHSNKMEILDSSTPNVDNKPRAVRSRSVEDTKNAKSSLKG
jgi:hypothetical protein